jgi:hypothetical protein
MSRKLTLRKLQRILGSAPEAIWGTGSEAALERIIRSGGRVAEAAPTGEEEFEALASSFADEEDVAAFVRCKNRGKSDRECFRVGDNGIGQFGKITAQLHTPMAAVHAEDMIARWGSVRAAAHKRVRVTVRGRTVIASVEDRLGVRGRIDLNPAAAKALRLTPPFLISCTWSWE